MLAALIPLHCLMTHAKAMNQDVKQKVLRLVQNWAVAFESKPTLAYAGEVYRQLQREGADFLPGETVHPDPPSQASASPLRTLLRQAWP